MSPHWLTSYYLDETDRSARTGGLGNTKNQDLHIPDFGKFTFGGLGGWGGGKRRENISKLVSNICIFEYLAYLLIFLLWGPWRYLISEMRGPVPLKNSKITQR